MANNGSKERIEERRKIDYIDPSLPEEAQELQRKAIAYRKSKNYYLEDSEVNSWTNALKRNQKRREREIEKEESLQSE